MQESVEDVCIFVKVDRGSVLTDLDFRACFFAEAVLIFGPCSDLVRDMLRRTMSPFIIDRVLHLR